MLLVEGNESEFFLLYSLEQASSSLDALPALDILGYSLTLLGVDAFDFEFCLEFVDPVTAIIAAPAAGVIHFFLNGWQQGLL